MAGWLRETMGALLCLFGAILPLVRAKLFTALVHMEGLVELEGKLASELRSYIRRERDQLCELERWSVRLFVVEMCTFMSASLAQTVHVRSCVHANHSVYGVGEGVIPLSHCVLVGVARLLAGECVEIGPMDNCAEQ